MRSILKRISPVSELQSRINKSMRKVYSNIYFSLDEPDFILKRKFNSNLNSYNSNSKVHQYLNNSQLISCPKCGNDQFSLNAKFCKICGHEVFPE